MHKPDDKSTVTLVKDAVHNPRDARHYMQMKPVAGHVRIRLGDRLLAESDNALRVLEVAHDLYDPVLYIPRSDVSAALRGSGKSTHCPIKGDTAYYDLAEGGGAEIAWSYVKPCPGAEPLRDRLAFDATRVTVEESPWPA